MFYVSPCDLPVDLKEISGEEWRSFLEELQYLGLYDVILLDFFMPEMTGEDDTYYTVRRGDCLWIIARNFMRRGILFSIIAERNNIKNPDLIFPQQRLQIPVGAK